MIRCGLMLVLAVSSIASSKDFSRLDQSMSVKYLQENISRTAPRLVYTPAVLEALKCRLNDDPVLQNMYRAVRLNAEAVLRKPLLERRMIGRRLLSTSREMLYRINMLGAVYLVEGDRQILARINEELQAVCAFEDWNPSHYLDVAEMSLAVALALDWAGADLPESTVLTAKKALLEKGLNLDENGKARIVGSSNNWNQVCNGGAIAAAVVLADDEPELAADTIRRALDSMPNALVQYAPAGVYPEGSTYWGYGTGYSVMTIAMLESAFGSDFGIAAVPGFMESAVFRVLCNAPSGWYYNFADCGDRRSLNGDVILAWFAVKSGHETFFEREHFLRPAQDMGKLSRHAGAALAWISQYRKKKDVTLPAAWKGDGRNPIVIFTGGESDPHNFYFGGKGGKASISHGNMDAGSFVFELNGVRWVVDPGNQRYHDLEKTGFNLWGKGQESERWTLLTKNNFGHSTLTVNGAPFAVDGFAPLIAFKEGNQPEAGFDLTAVYGDHVQRAIRRFVKDSPVSLIVEDRVELSDATQNITWQLMTTADVELVDGGALLTQDGKVLRVENLTHPGLTFSWVSLDPPPLELDRRIKGLKRIEFNLPADCAVDDCIVFKVRLSGNEKNDS